MNIYKFRSAFVPFRTLLLVLCVNFHDGKERLEVFYKEHFRVLVRIKGRSESKLSDSL